MDNLTVKINSLDDSVLQKVGFGKVLKMQDGIITANGLNQVCQGELVNIGFQEVKGLVLSLK